ncbi:hypothetical protein [uncultured Microscilla sp.]|uniref:hypothetical protein n=1 Tax=uncultured Microscilla sp. TaxID=432653 RepID=UPI00261B00A5|nr:hypothetical protein [uncultured Microscilla sp.]
MDIVITIVVIFIIYRLFFYKTPQEHIIKDINDQGFTLVNIVRKKDNAQPTLEHTPVYWKNLQDIRLNKSKDTLIFTDIKGKVFKLDQNATFWHELLQSIPSYFTKFDHQYVQDFLAQNENKTYLDIIEATNYQVTYEVSNHGKISQESFQWQEVEAAHLNETKTALKIQLKTGKTFTLTDDIDNWYWLLKYMPARFEDAVYIKALFDSFTACEVCGCVAMLGNECQACYEEVWQESSLYPEKEGFIKERQLEIFGTSNPLERVNLDIPEGKAFEKNPDWQLLVTEEEILDFSQENYWQEES